MSALVGAVHDSAHRTLGCMQCHDASLSTKLRHVRVHLSRHVPEQIVLREQDVLVMQAKCQSCHQREYASWHAGGHAATFKEIFADPSHNSRRHLMEDCLRCHGMHFKGSIKELVTPYDTQGPWRIVPQGLTAAPVMPCMTCHQVHRQGQPMMQLQKRVAIVSPHVISTLGLYDRREQVHFQVATLAIPQLYDGARPLRMSEDPLQGLCYQCHAPRVPEPGSPAAMAHWGEQAGSGDDRTPMGVHEGLSCRACHTGHDESTAASCKQCHPKMSDCGQDVEKMDTTFANPKSAHNIHWVRCTDCHAQGIPKKKPV